LQIYWLESPWVVTYSVITIALASKAVTEGDTYRTNPNHLSPRVVQPKLANHAQSEHEEKSLNDVDDLVLSGTEIEPDEVRIRLGCNVNVERDRRDLISRTDIE